MLSGFHIFERLAGCILNSLDRNGNYFQAMEKWSIDKTELCQSKY
jgi:hypothetical protein